MNPLSRLFNSLRGKSSGNNRETTRDLILGGIVPARSICAEIGVYKGDFSAKILQQAKPKKLHLIDPWKYETADTYRESWYGGDKGASQKNMDLIFEGVESRFSAGIAAGVIEIHRAASLDAAAQFADEYFDWVYIDGNHQYEFVKSDLEAYLPKVRKGGFMVGDDYQDGGWWKGGVKKAVDEFVKNSAIEVVLLQSDQFCLKK